MHNVTTEEATAIVDSLADRQTSLIWEVNGKKRVLSTKLGMRAKTLILLHGSTSEVAESDLVPARQLRARTRDLSDERSNRLH